MRVDQILVKQNKFTSRTKAQKAIKDKRVYLPTGELVQKVALDLPETTPLIIKKAPEYVSRGAYKLIKAISEFKIDFNDRLVLDIGASTGGFTQVALQHGAKQVYAVDVGTQQLAPELAHDSRVVVREKYNFRYAKKCDFPPEKFDLIQGDVSFISLRFIIPPATELLKPEGQAIFLIKPQFEAGKTHLAKNGIIKDPRVHLLVLQQVIGYFTVNHLVMRGLTYSPIKGQHGNPEFLALVQKSSKPGLTFSEQQLKAIIRQAQQNS